MSKTLYFDAFNGVAGDMIVGALVDLGVPLGHLISEVNRLGLTGFVLSAEPIERQGLRGVNFTVREIDAHKHDQSHRHDQEAGDDHPHRHDHEPEHSHPHDHRHEHPHGHHHDHEHGEPGGRSHTHEHSHQGNFDPGSATSHGHQHHRGLTQIKNLIQSSELDPWVKAMSIRIFERLGEAEARVHGTTPDDVHFHEVGAIDAIVDVVGSCAGFRYLGIERFFSSPLELGGGVVSFSHGTWPVPAPATAELVKGFPTRLGGMQAEMTTPTGAAIVTTLVDPTVSIPVMAFEKQGFGAGDRQMPQVPNMLRLMLGETPNSGLSGRVDEEDRVFMLEAAIDDMDPQAFGYFLDLALDRGALDVYFTPIHMKKNRPGVLVTLLCDIGEREKFTELLFRETTTLGVRYSSVSRLILNREMRELETPYGRLRIKIGRWRGRIQNIQPEYEDLREIAERTGYSLKQVRQQVLQEIGKQVYE